MNSGRGAARPYQETYNCQGQKLVRQKTTPSVQGDETWMPGERPGVGKWNPLELLDSLELADHPPVGAWSHQDNIVHRGMFVVDCLITIADYQIVLRRVV